jgi:nitrogen fixation protein FixH
MAQAAAMVGKVANMVSGVETIEIKATVAEHQIDAALAHYGLTVDNDDERYIYFFDTPDLTLLREGIIARARRIVGEEHDSTVKFRPVVPAEIPAKWCKHRGFKIEADASEKGVVKSASFTMPVEKGLIKRVAAGDKSVAKLFSKEQERFLADMADRKIDFESLAVLGPLQAHRWQFTDPGCPWEITAELWKREDGDRLMEFSIKAPIVQAAAAIGGFRAFVAEVGAQRDADEQSKTRWALDFYAARVGKDD